MFGPRANGIPWPLVWVAVLATPVMGNEPPVEANRGSNGESLRRFAYQRPKLGTIVRVTVYCSDEALANDAVGSAYARAKELNAILSDYEPESELNRLCASAGSGRAIPVSQPLFEVLEASLALSRATNGRFDVTAGPLTKLWRLARRTGRMPSSEALKTARQAVGWSHVRLDVEHRTVQLQRPGMRLDLGGIAKGYVADEMLRVLRQRGLPRALVDAGGDLVVGDPPPGARGWRIAVEGLADADDEPYVVELANAGVATSGDLYQFVEIDGVRYSHVVDPETGLGLTRRSSVTVVAPDGTTADGYASALSVLGPPRGIALARRTKRIEALVSFLENDEPRSLTTDDFPPRSTKP